MTAEQIAEKYVHGLHDALTDAQEIKDMMTDIETYAESYHQAKLKLLGDVVIQSQLLCPKCKSINVEMDYGLGELYCHDCEKIICE